MYTQSDVRETGAGSTHDKHVRRAYLAPQEVIEFLLDHPSEAALRDCYVTNEVIEYPTPWTPLAVFLDRRPEKGLEVDVRLLERPKRKPRQVKLRLPKTGHKPRARRGFQGSEMAS
jgi:hypothetical protein